MKKYKKIFLADSSRRLKDHLDFSSICIKRGYAEMVLQSSTSNKAILKWKEK